MADWPYHSIASLALLTKPLCDYYESKSKTQIGVIPSAMTTPLTDSERLIRGYRIALICAVILSTTAVFIRYLTQTYGIPPLVLAFWRDAFTALTLLIALGLRSPRLLSVEAAHLRYLLIYGLALADFNTLWTLSVSLIGASVATLLVYSSAAFTPLFGWWFLEERVNGTTLAAVTLSLGGCLLVSGSLDPAAWNANLLGILTGVSSGLSYAVYSLMGRSASRRGLNPWTTIFYTFGFAALFLLLPNLLPVRLLPGAAAHPADLFWLGKALKGWGILFLLAAGPTVMGFGLYNVSLVYLPSGVANLIVTLEPAFTAVIAYFLLGERLTAIQLIGSLSILAGVVVLRLNLGENPSQPSRKPVAGES
jgi:drug/metabolite transporter (DMT)-like permease